MNSRRAQQASRLPSYTIGQRKGWIAAPEPLYVLATDPARNALVVGTETSGKQHAVGQSSQAGLPGPRRMDHSARG